MKDKVVKSRKKKYNNLVLILIFLVSRCSSFMNQVFALWAKVMYYGLLFRSLNLCFELGFRVYYNIIFYNFIIYCVCKW
ncbi:hypothetical protein YYG_00021 [Plasmodium vinckei petteri]|uniref:Uncharacterized protein n=1 Tax=Plasmodium vinckei petteri TaxID=138298 RepID=W7AZL2_PLAVN|nr:hypothetical protein YYG_00021 [Plasmodium vinckei petteri]